MSDASMIGNAGSGLDQGPGANINKHTVTVLMTNYNTRGDKIAYASVSLFLGPTFVQIWAIRSMYGLIMLKHAHK
jgi:hypothetical protein